jgi:molybdate transport system substrate-binding protein
MNCLPSGEIAGVPVRHLFRGQPVLARQIEAGGKVDVFISADQNGWTTLQARNLINKPTRRNLPAIASVLIAPADSKIELKIAPGFDLAGALGGNARHGRPRHRSRGRYARSAALAWRLGRSGGRLVRADNAQRHDVRGAARCHWHRLHHRRADRFQVRIVDTFPENTHPRLPIPGPPSRAPAVRR